MSSQAGPVPDIFDRKARALRRGRVSGGGFIAETMARDLIERLDDVKRDFTTALIVGAEPVLIEAAAARGIATTICDPAPRRATAAMDEDRIDFAPASFDLILATGTLDTVTDLPGALILMRRTLRPDGLLLANFAAAPSLISLRRAVAVADAALNRAIARFHPQIDVRSAGDLLTRAGFALPVADVDTLTVAYASIDRLLADLRDASATNMLSTRRPVSRQWLAAVSSAFSALAGPDGKTIETLSYITLTGWAPSPDQPKPAARGSGKTSLASVLNKRLD